MKKRLLFPILLVIALIFSSFTVYANEDTLTQYTKYDNVFSLSTKAGKSLTLFTKNETISDYYTGGSADVVYLSEKIRRDDAICMNWKGADGYGLPFEYLSGNQTYLTGETDQTTGKWTYFPTMGGSELNLGLSKEEPGLIPGMPGMTKTMGLVIKLEFGVEEEEVINAIEALPNKADLKNSDKEKVESAREKYEALSQWEAMDPDIKNKVTNLDKLETLEAEFASASAVETVINNLPNVNDLSADSKEAVDEALEKFNNLTPGQQSLVTNANNLILANAIVEKLIAVNELHTTSEELEKAKKDKDIISVMKKSVKKVKAKSGKKKATISWKTLGKGYKYEVFVSKNISKGYKKTVTSSKNKSVVKKIGKSKLKSQRTYYVKVRGFKILDGEKVYTQFSDTVKVKVK